MITYELTIIPPLNVEAESEEEAKQYLIDALADCGISAGDVFAEPADTQNEGE